jgi:predicted alpha/beta-hydrolase family hydrolase
MAMTQSATKSLTVGISAREAVTVRLYAAGGNRSGITLILGHGAGADQSHAFMVGFAEGLSARGIDIVTFNFLYTEQRRRAPDKNDKLESCYAAVIEAVRSQPAVSDNRVAAGGKSMGGRIASQIAATGAAGDLIGLVFLGYPLHPPGQPKRLRSEHLPQVKRPMLFVQGSRDTFGTPDQLQPIIARLTPKPDLYVVEGGDHSLSVRKKQSVSQKEIYEAVQDKIAGWLKEVAQRRN